MASNNLNVTKRHFLTAATSAVGGVGIAAWAWPFVASWNPSERAKALGAPVTADISNLEPGAQMIVPWRGQPVWIVRRTESMLAALDDVEPKLADPESEEEQQPKYISGRERSIKPEYLVMVGKCTHLGCSPTYNPEFGSVSSDWKGGFFCPCHGSKFDLSGRVYKGVPAPFNMKIPPYHYLSETVIEIGVDPKEEA